MNPEKNNPKKTNNNIVPYSFSNSAVRVGRIGYANTVPIYFGLDNGLKPDWMHLVDGPPALLNRMMAGNALDISPVSSVAYAKNQEEWLLLPELSISCNGPVLSVLLASHFRLDDLDKKTIHLTDESAAAADLLKVIFSIKKLDPQFVRGTITSSKDFAACTDAALIIGDKALTGNWKNDFRYIYDLGEVWKKMTGLPFVFALWAVRKSFAKSRPTSAALVTDLLQKSFDFGKKNKDRIVLMSANRLGIEQEILKTYYRNIYYHLNASKIRGLNAFFDQLFIQKRIAKPVNMAFLKTTKPEYKNHHAA